MRIRSIKPAFWKSLSIGALPVETRLHFIGLWNYADDEGRGIDDARLLKGELWPLDDKITVSKVDQMQLRLAEAGRIVRYTDGVRYYFAITNWSEHQRVDKPQDSPIPPPDGAECSPTVPGTLWEGSLLDRKGKEGRGEEGDRNGLATVVPNGRPPDRIYELLFALETGLAYSKENRTVLTSTAAGVLNRAVAEVRATKITAEALGEAIQAWPQVMGDATCTASAVKKHLPRLAAASRGMVARGQTSDFDRVMGDVAKIGAARRGA